MYAPPAGPAYPSMFTCNHAITNVLLRLLPILDSEDIYKYPIKSLRIKMDV
jgi:hypothetical protein